MGHASGFGLLVAGVLLVVLGIVLWAGWLDWLLNVAAIILIVLGLILGVSGVMKMGKSSTDY